MALLSLRLAADDAALKAKFFALRTSKDIADLLEVPDRTLRFYIYKKENYREFELDKRSGSKRIISAPDTPLKIIQRKLAQVLYAVYGSRSSVHGFAKQRSIRSNAARHLGAEWLLTFDLKDFFPSIHFGRVAGLFAGSVYKLPIEVAQILAQICCYKGALPAGAPTSPVVANMVCARMDSDFKNFALSAGCKYTRYADDITVSTKLLQFPSSVCEREENVNRWKLGEKLEALLERNGFRLHPKKLKVRGRFSSQEITGIRINSGMSVRRQLQRQVRAMLHACEKFGLEQAEAEYWAKYQTKQRRNRKPAFIAVLRGKIEFIGFVQGRDSILYVNLLQRMQRLFPKSKMKPIHVKSSTHVQVIRQSIWLLSNSDDDKQGTAFAVDGNRLLTAEHNVPENEFLFASLPGIRDKHIVTVTKRYSDLDIAELSIQSDLPVQLTISGSTKIELLDKVCVVGFPNYHIGDSVAFRFGKVVQRREYPGSVMNAPRVEHFITDADIVKGNSGGPVLDANNRVVGIAVKGLDAPGSSGENDQLSSFVPIYLLPSQHKQV